MSDAFNNDDDMTGNGSYLPSLPKLYQNIFKSLGINGPSTQADPSTIVPPQGMQDFYNSAFRALGFPPSPRNPNRIQRYPDHTGATQEGLGPYGRLVPNNENYGVGLDFSGYSPINAIKINRNINQTYGSRGYGAGSYASSQQYPDQQIFSDRPNVGDASTMPVYPQRQSSPPMYTPPETNVPMPSFMRNRATVTDPLQRTMLGLDDDGTEVTQSSGGSQLSDPRAVRALDPSARPYRPRPDEGGGSDNAPLITSGMIPSTGRAHMTSPIIPKNAVASKGRAHMSASSQEESDLPASKEAGDTGEFLNNDPDDMRPGSLGEAQKLFPGRPLQQAIYYTEPEHGKNGGGGGMRRLGVGADTKGLNPDYIARIWEPADMSGGEKFIRGAYETPGKNPITWSPHKAEGGSIDAAQKIANQKATPCHVGLINMAVGGRTDHLPMHVREGSYVIPADVVSALGEGNTMAGSKVIDHMFANRPPHKAVGGPLIGLTKKPQFLQSSRTLPGDIELSTNGEDTAGTPLVGNMFTSAPFGISNKSPQFSELKKPSLNEYGDMQKLFNVPSTTNFSPPQIKSAAGGPIMSGNRRPVPIVAAGGEYVIDPDDVARYGGGDINKGHDKLDAFVKHARKHLIKTLSKLPGPRRD